ncbi:MAG: hypothetical protein E8D41_03290 [Nitrospira sp.]|nr:MAG: hypothetical protein E8D41_03290 [Nitrospira sp.]
MRKAFVPLALTLAALYLTLSVSAVTCLFAHESESRASHHHTGGTAKSSLCTWACDANPTVDFSIITAETQQHPFVAMLPLAESSTSHFLFQQSARSRAPPYSYIAST